MAVGETLGQTTTIAGSRLRRNRHEGVADSRAEGRLVNRILLVALALGGCVDVLFYKKATGISTLLFICLVVGAMIVMGLMERVHVAWRNLWLVLPLLFFAGMVAVRDSVDLTLANLSSTFVLLLLFVCFFTEGRV